MHYLDIPAHEARAIAKAETAPNVLKRTAIALTGESLTFTLHEYEPAGTSGYYYEEKFAKKRIVLHFTAGYLGGDLTTLTKKDYHVSTPFVIGRNGAVVRLFSSALWSYHLGIKGTAYGPSGLEDKSSIGIEISNIGPLQESGGKLLTIYKDAYCSLADHEAYIKLDQPYRGYSYFASYTDAQYDSIIILLRYLTTQYQIPRAFLPEEKRYLPSTDVVNFPGIVSHVNYRETGKWDIGPAFDWARVIDGVQDQTFTPSALAPVARTRSLSSSMTEEDLDNLRGIHGDISEGSDGPEGDPGAPGFDGEE